MELLYTTWTRRKVATFHAAAEPAAGATLVSDDIELSSLSGDDAETAGDDHMHENAQAAKRPRVAVEQNGINPQRQRQAWPPLPSGTSTGMQTQFDELRVKVDALSNQFAQLMLMMKQAHEGGNSNPVGGAMPPLQQ